MRTTIALTLATVLTVSLAGCSNRPLRNFFHRGAACGSAATVPTTLPIINDMTSYSPGCGIEESCPTCGPMGGTPYMYEGGAYPIDGTMALPEPQ